METLYRILLTAATVTAVMNGAATASEPCGVYGHSCTDSTHFSMCVLLQDGTEIPTEDVFSCPIGLVCDFETDVICVDPALQKTTESITAEDSGDATTSGGLIHVEPSPEDQGHTDKVDVGGTEEPEVSTIEVATDSTQLDIYTTTATDDVLQTDVSTEVVTPDLEISDSPSIPEEGVATDSSSTNQEFPNGGAETPVTDAESPQLPNANGTIPEVSTDSKPEIPELQETTPSQSSSVPEWPVVTPETPPQGFICPNSGRFPAPPSCTRFHVCYRFFWIRKHFITSCKAGLEFSPSRKRCVLRRKSDCVSRQRAEVEDDSDSDDSGGSDE